MAKKRRRFRGSPAQHKEEAIGYSVDLRLALRSGGVMAAQGQCNVALRRLVEAAGLMHAYSVNRRWAGKHSRLSKRKLTQLEGKVRACFAGRR
jgi:hypothetical protein